MKKITLSGFGDFDEREDDLKSLMESAKRHGVECYATYYDHELKGERTAVEAVTMELCNISRDEWADNALTESDI